MSIDQAVLAATAVLSSKCTAALQTVGGETLHIQCGPYRLCSLSAVHLSHTAAIQLLCVSELCILCMVSALRCTALHILTLVSALLLVTATARRLHAGDGATGTSRLLGPALHGAGSQSEDTDMANQYDSASSDHATGNNGATGGQRKPFWRISDAVDDDDDEDGVLISNEEDPDESYNSNENDALAAQGSLANDDSSFWPFNERVYDDDEDDDDGALEVAVHTTVPRIYVDL
eukprot:5871-Heterococcus_DN1.PRE.2